MAKFQYKTPGKLLIKSHKIVTDHNCCCCQCQWSFEYKIYFNGYLSNIRAACNEAEVDFSDYLDPESWVASGDGWSIGTYDTEAYGAFTIDDAITIEPLDWSTSNPEYPVMAYIYIHSLGTCGITIDGVFYPQGYDLYQTYNITEDPSAITFDVQCGDQS